jgi:hypothetical protein
MEYEIDPISSASPDMNDPDFAALKQSIAEIGQLVSIVVAGGKIIDGRKRYRACTELGKVPSVIELPLGADTATHAAALNLLRTQYSPSQRAMYAAAIATRRAGRNWDANSPNLENNPPTTRQAASAAGVSLAQLGYAKQVRATAIPEVVAAVERGDLTVHGALAVAKAPKHEQPAALSEAIERPKVRDGRRAAPPALADGRRPRMHRRGQAELADKSIGLLAYTAQELEGALDGVGEIPDPERRLAQLDDVAATVRRAREILKRRAGG